MISARRIVIRVMSLPEKEVAQLLSEVMGEFEDRHENLERIFRNRFSEVRRYLNEQWEASEERQALIGSYFTHEYSPESALCLILPSYHIRIRTGYLAVRSVLS